MDKYLFLNCINCFYLLAFVCATGFGAMETLSWLHFLDYPWYKKKGNHHFSRNLIIESLLRFHLRYLFHILYTFLIWRNITPLSSLFLGCFPMYIIFLINLWMIFFIWKSMVLPWVKFLAWTIVQGKNNILQSREKTIGIHGNVVSLIIHKRKQIFSEYHLNHE